MTPPNQQSNVDEAIEYFRKNNPSIFNDDETCSRIAHARYLKTLITEINRLRESNEHIDKILSMTDDQIKALAVDKGECPECLGLKTKATIAEVLTDHMKKEIHRLRSERGIAVLLLKEAQPFLESDYRGQTGLDLTGSDLLDRIKETLQKLGEKP